MTGARLSRTAGLGHLPVDRPDNRVSRGDSAHVVGDDQNRSAGRQSRKSPLHLRLVLNIKRGGDLVKVDDGRVLQQPAHKLIAVGGGSCQNVLSTCAVPSQADALEHRIVKEHNILENHGTGFEQDFRIDGGDIHTADRNPSRVNLPEAGGEAGTGTLPGSRRTDKSRHFSFSGCEAHSLQHILSVAGEAHIAKHDVILWGKGFATCGRRRVEDLHQTPGGDL